ncbi:MAG: LTA synthase family protein [Pseudomonadales bacterium]
MDIVKRLGPLRVFVIFFIGSIIFLTIARLTIAGLIPDRIPDASTLLHVMILGLRMDTMLLCMAMLIPVIVTLCLPAAITSSRFYLLIIRMVLCFWMTVFAFMEFATPTYIDFFDARPGRIFFEYLEYPKEVSALLLGGFALQSTLITIGSIIVCTSSYLGIRSAQINQTCLTYKRQLLLLPVIIAILVLGARSTTGHRPLNASSVAFSNDQLLNELALNSTYTVLYAIYGLKNEGDPSKLYTSMPEAEVISRVRKTSLIDDSAFSEHRQPTYHQFGPAEAGAKKNLVIILEESMGARFIGKLGGLPLSPKIDALADEGLWFTNLYATGIRSARGIEAVVTGFPPSNARSVLKLGLAQQGFYTMAKTLKEHGYRNYFIYGGESHFDNMSGFLLNNGFDVAIDENDFSEWKFKGSWGVSDEDLFDRAHSTFEAQEGPFFALVFSSSFHSPFEFPEGRIELHDDEHNTKYNAVKYADYAVGYYFDKAKRSNYWGDTIFLVVADHDESPRGSSLVPVSSYHIPGLILGSGVEASVYSEVTSHIDLMPTLFSLMSIGGSAPYIGHNIFLRPLNYPGRAIMQFGNNHAYMLGDQVVIHRPEKGALQFTYSNKALVPTALDKELVKDALAMALIPGLLYKNRWYQAE